MSSASRPAWAQLDPPSKSSRRRKSRPPRLKTSLSPRDLRPRRSNGGRDAICLALGNNSDPCVTLSHEAGRRSPPKYTRKGRAYERLHSHSFDFRHRSRDHSGDRSLCERVSRSRENSAPGRIPRPSGRRLRQRQMPSSLGLFAGFCASCPGVQMLADAPSESACARWAIDGASRVSFGSASAADGTDRFRSDRRAAENEFRRPSVRPSVVQSRGDGRAPATPSTKVVLHRGVYRCEIAFGYDTNHRHSFLLMLRRG